MGKDTSTQFGVIILVMVLALVALSYLGHPTVAAGFATIMLTVAGATFLHENTTVIEDER